MAAFVLAVLGTSAIAVVLAGSPEDVTRVQWLLLCAPCLVAAAPLLWRARPVQLVSTGLLAAMVVLTALSVGVFLVPSLALMVTVSLATKGAR